jgi:hypothetical protein
MRGGRVHSAKSPRFLLASHGGGCVVEVSVTIHRGSWLFAGWSRICFERVDICYERCLHRQRRVYAAVRLRRQRHRIDYGNRSLVCLKFAVGQAVDLDCPFPIAGTTTTSTTVIAGDSLLWGIGRWDLEAWGE